MLRMNQYRRRAIGLVELMVAMALCIGIMWILAESFKLGLDMTRELRATGKMVNHLDGAKAIMTHDLAKDHFLREQTPWSGVRLSQQRCDLLNGTTGTGWAPPLHGFFRIFSPAPTNQLTDADGFSMNIATNCALHFTSVLPAAERNLFTVKASNGLTYSSRAAEIAYFLVESGQKTSANGQMLYKLIRRQRLVAVSNDETAQLKAGINSAADTEVIAGVYDANPLLKKVYTLAEIRNPALRLKIDPSTFPVVSAATPIFGLGHLREGEDLLLTGVLSFEVQVDWSPNTAGTLVTTDDVPGSTLGPRTPAQGNWDYPFDSLAYPGGNAGQNDLNGPGGVNGLFDTWIGAPLNSTWNTGLNVATQNAQKLPLAIRVKQLKITLRIFDSSTKQTRQSTFVVEM